MNTRYTYLLALSFTLPLTSCHFVGLRPDFSVMGDAFTPVEHDSVYVEGKPDGAAHLAVYQPPAPAEATPAAPMPAPVAAAPMPAPKPAPTAAPATESKSLWASIGDLFTGGDEETTRTVAQARPQVQATPKPQPQPAVASQPQTAPYAQNQPSAPTVLVYTVQPGDSLSRIAKRCNVPLGSLAAANGIDLKKPLIHPGQKLRIPQGGAAIIAPPASAPRPILPAPAAAKPVVPATQPAPVQAAAKPALPPAPKGKYRVCAGDTLYRIARSHGISLQELLHANNLDEQGARNVRVGTLLTIPTKP